MAVAYAYSYYPSPTRPRPIGSPEEMAARLLRWAGLGPPVDVARATSLLHLDIEYMRLSGSAAGMLVREYDGRWLIIVNSRYEPGEQRFTIAHELGHWTLHRRLVRQYGDSRQIRDRILERQANEFAYALLMPPGEVEEEIMHRSDLSVEVFERLYGVSRAVAANALRRMGFDLWRPQ